MKILVLNGSPKKKLSVTLQSLKFLELHHSDHSFEYVQVIKELRTWEDEPSELISFCQSLKEFEIIIWAFPVYHLLVPAHYKKFIELIFENDCARYFQGKYTAVFTTSVHYADNNAHDYLHAVCDDLGMSFIGSLSHHMDDLVLENRQKELKTFFAQIIMSVEEKLSFARQFATLPQSDYRYRAGKPEKIITTGKRIIIITDETSKDYNLREMIGRVDSLLTEKPEIINLRDLKISGYCLGCCRCGYDNTCVYKDGYRSFLDYVIDNADIIIYAGTIQDRYLSSLFKLYHDRSFTFNHVPHFRGKQFGYLISGALSHLDNLRQIIELYHQESTNLGGIVSDEAENDTLLDEQIYSLLKTLVFAAENNYFKASTFLGQGQLSVFSGMINDFQGAIFLADYRYYKKQGYLSRKSSLFKRAQALLMRHLMTREPFRKSVQQNMYQHMISAHLKVLEKAKVRPND